MTELFNLVKQFAPTLAANLLTGGSGAVVSALAAKFGSSTDIGSIVQAMASDTEAAQKLQELELEFFKVEAQNVTSRWVADDQSDSWLSKNIRPMTLIYLISAYTAFAIASIFDYETKQAYVELLGQWGMIVMTAYFGGRTIEKVMKK